MTSMKQELEKLFAGELSEESEQKVRAAAFSDPEISRELASIDALTSVEESIRLSRITPSKDFTSEVLLALDSPLGAPSPKIEKLIERFFSNPICDFLATNLSPALVSRGLVASAMCACISLGFWMGRAQPQFYPVHVAEVLVPTQDIPAGTELTKSMFRRVARPLSEVTEQSIRSLDDIGGSEVAHALILADYPLDRRYLRAPAAQAQPAIPLGYRAVAVGFETAQDFTLSVGNEIEVVLALPTNEGPLHVTKISSRATIIAIQPKSPSNKGEVSTNNYVATVLVPEIEAAKIDLGRSQGDVLLMTTSTPHPASA